MATALFAILAEELDARGWTLDHLATLMPGDALVNRCALDILATGMVPLDAEMADEMATALGVSSVLLLNLDAMPELVLARAEAT